MKQRVIIRWVLPRLLKAVTAWRVALREKIGAGSEFSSWWYFISMWDLQHVVWVRDFIAGQHQFEPFKQYKFTNEIIQVWSYLDRLMIHLILQIIRPTFKHIISPLCTHLVGPSAVKTVTRQIKAALGSGQYNYYLRVDIKSYYKSINHRLLIKQLEQHFMDPILLRYLKDIVTIGIDYGGNILLPASGIPVRSSLSPFFGALYLSELDQAFTKRKGVFYLRYMDDIIILTKTKRLSLPWGELCGDANPAR